MLPEPGSDRCPTTDPHRAPHPLLATARHPAGAGAGVGVEAGVGVGAGAGGRNQDQNSLHCFTFHHSQFQSTQLCVKPMLIQRKYFTTF